MIGKEFPKICCCTFVNLFWTNFLCFILEICNDTLCLLEHICDMGGYKFQIDQAHIGGAAFDVRDNLTALFRGNEANICLFGRLHTGFLRSSPPRLQNSIHGTLPVLDKIISPTKFCDIDKNACSNTSPPCQNLTLFAQESGNPIQNFCSCTSILVPNVPGNVSKFNYGIALIQACPKSGPRAKCGPWSNFDQPAWLDS